MQWRTAPLIGLVFGLILISGAAAMATARVSTARADLDRALDEQARAEAAALDQAFARAREVVLLTATNTAFRDAYLEDVRGGVDAEAALAALETVYPELRRASLIDRDGTERAGIRDGAPVPVTRLGRDGRSTPFFRQAIALAPGQTYQGRPYASPDTGDRVLSTSTPIVLPDGSRPGILHFEVGIESFRPEATGDAAKGGRLAVVDATTGAVVLEADRGPGRRGPNGGPDDGLGWLQGASGTGAASRGGDRVAFRSVAVAGGNVNRWLVVASAPTVSAWSSIGIVAPTLLGVGCLAFLIAAIGFRRAGAQERRARLAAEQRSRMDSLTGLYNRRHAVETLTAELSRGAREGHSPSALMLDIDHFKQVNDVYGHHAGDIVIQEVGRRIRATVRDYDVVARWGGEEFCVIIPGAVPEQAVLALAERVRQSLEGSPVELGNGKSLAITASVGAATARESLWTAESLVDAADRALYTAKRRGRNQVVLFSTMTTADLSADEPEAIRLAQGLALAASVRDASPDHHCDEVADLSSRIADRLGLSESIVMRCRLAGWVHDVGKLAVPDRIILKTTPLDEEEREILHSHVTLGAEIIRRIAGLRDAAVAVLHHHERWDGSGYPDRLTGPDIPIEARIVACADAYSAITTGRPYQPPLPAHDAVAQLRRSAGKSLDPTVVEALAEILEEIREAHATPGARVPQPA